MRFVGGTRPDYRATYEVLSSSDKSLVDRGVAVHRERVRRLSAEVDEVLAEVNRRIRSAQQGQDALARAATNHVADVVREASERPVALDRYALGALSGALQGSDVVPPFLHDDLDDDPRQDMLKTYRLFGSAMRAVESGDRGLQSTLAMAIGVPWLTRRLFPRAARSAVLRALEDRRREILIGSPDARRARGAPVGYLARSLLSPMTNITMEHVAAYANYEAAVRAAVSEVAVEQAGTGALKPRFHDLPIKELQRSLYDLARDSTLAGGLARDALWRDVTEEIVPKLRTAWEAMGMTDPFAPEQGEYGVENRRQEADDVFREATWSASTVFLHFTDRSNRIIAGGGLRPKSDHGYTRINGQCEGVHFTGTIRGHGSIDYRSYAAVDSYADGPGAFAMTLGDATRAGLSIHGRVRLTGGTAQPEDVFVTDANGEFGSVPLSALGFIPFGSPGSVPRPSELRVFDDLTSAAKGLATDERTYFVRLARDPMKRRSEHTDGLSRDVRVLSPAILGRIDGMELSQAIAASRGRSSERSAGQGLS